MFQAKDDAIIHNLELKMQKYIGTKIINAKPMNRLDYNILRGWELPADENGADDGFLVEYIDGGKANHPDFNGYISWSPADVFDRAYHPVSAMSFGDAIVMLKAGKKVCRSGWNGKGMWLALILDHHYVVVPWLFDHRSENPCNPDLLPWIGMKTADNGFVPWLASQTDMLADDWVAIE